MKRLLCLSIVLLAALPAQARMYQWVNPHSGRTQMSGKPPAWYRSDQPGPRVFVFENGRLIDDTGREVTAAERAALRSAAFAAKPAVNAETANAAGSAPIAPGSSTGSSTDAGNALERGFGESEDSAAPTANEPPDATIARLKSIIDAWEQQQTEEARRLLERSAVVPSAEEGGTSPAPPVPSAEGNAAPATQSPAQPQQ